ncbi:MAG: LacI family transcriptional regulator [Anaerolineae bacterium]|nr:LacI family transcriptional regulator [Anaerolineae bacterium]NUQ04112.1 LacI family DNA-binding transcriptional regulator [Anaerolineae bacterium]
MPGKKRPTQADVAKQADVSQAMVSYVINNNSAVSIPEETRRRILDAMHSLGYVPNVTARRLRASKTFTIAGVIPDITNPFYPAFERGIQDAADRYGYDLIMVNTDGTVERERKCLSSMLQGRVDGIVGVFFHLQAMDLSALIEQGIGVVRFESMPKVPGTMPIDNIFIDNIAASRKAVEYLIDRGHRRIAMLTSQEGPARFREIGYREALEALDIAIDPTLLSLGAYSEDGGYVAMNRLLQGQTRPGAVFAANDLMAMGAMIAIREAGLTIPRDIAIMGFDDIPTARLVYPALTTVAQFQRDLGKRAAEMLFERLNGAAPPTGRSQQMPYKLIIRESA